MTKAINFLPEEYSTKILGLDYYIKKEMLHYFKIKATTIMEFY